MFGYTAEVIACHGAPDAGVGFIQKPLGSKTLAVIVREALDNADA